MYKNDLEKFQVNGPILKSDIEEVEEKLHHKFPFDYVEFMLEANGGEGTIGESSYLRFVENGGDYSCQQGIYSPRDCT